MKFVFKPFIQKINEDLVLARCQRIGCETHLNLKFRQDYPVPLRVKRKDVFGGNVILCHQCYRKFKEENGFKFPE